MENEPSAAAKDNGQGADTQDAAASELNRQTSSPPKSGTRTSDKLLSRAHTMLKGATLSRAGTNASQIKSTVAQLHREKTRLETATVTEAAGDEDGDDMKNFLSDMKKTKKKNTKEFTDSDFDTDLEDDDSTTTPSQWGPKRLYLQTCKKLGVRPVPAVEEGIEDKTVTVQNRCLNSLDVLSIANALISNESVNQLVLDGNQMGDDGAHVIAWLTKDQDNYIEKLSIANNEIGPEGIKAIGEMLISNRQITYLNISGNHARDEHVAVIAKALKQNHHLSHMNLSYNGIGDRGAKLVASAIATNEGLQSLDLSWNKIQPQGGVAICHALRENVLLKSLNLSMNGLSTPGSLFLGETLKKNESLTYLDVSFNRIYDEGAAHIAKGLEKNERLHNLIMHNNPLTSIGAMSLIAGIRANENTAMWRLDLITVPILKEVVTAYEGYQDKNPGFEFRYGIVLDTEPGLVGGINFMNNRNPMALVREYIENEGLRLVDFFRIMDKDHGGSISRQEFLEGLQSANVNMTQSQLDQLIDTLDRDGDGEIDYRELVDGDREFRRKMLKKKLAAIEAMKTVIAKPKPEDSWIG